MHTLEQGQKLLKEGHQNPGLRKAGEMQEQPVNGDLYLLEVCLIE